MVPQWLIEKKRDGQSLTEEEIKFFIGGFTEGTIPEYQMAAMAMAIYFQGMTPEETATLTEVMMNSGDVVDTSSIRLPKVDKHSTGGIGDKVSLILAPLAACCNVAIPMISGRGLGITGGTLDKLESIPGYRTDLSDDEFLHVVNTCGCAITGQTGQLAPADKKLYALRDVTGTVASIPLITASIMSKKMAAGIDSLVLDVKWGKGAFMKTREDAQVLAQSMVNVGTEMGKGMAALITDMNQPLGRTAGNALEIVETIESLSGNGPSDLMEITMTLCAQMLLLTDRAASTVEAFDLLSKKLSSGEALAKFKEMVKLQGGDPSVVDNPELLPKAAIQKAIPAPEAGYIVSVDAEGIGKACLMLGAGRQKTDDVIDFAVGASGIAKMGQAIEKGQPLVVLHANDEKLLSAAEKLAGAAFGISEKQIKPPALIAEVLEG